MNAPLYTTEILRLATSLGQPRVLEREDGVAERRSPTCGSRVHTIVRVDENGRVQAVNQQIHACAFGQASAALLEQGAIGLGPSEVDDAVTSITAWLAGSDELPSWPNISALAPARSRRSRHAAILLPFRSLAAALADAAERGRAGDLPAP